MNSTDWNRRGALIHPHTFSLALMAVVHISGKPTAQTMLSSNIWPTDTAGLFSTGLIFWMENNISLTSEHGLGIYNWVTKRKSDRHLLHVQFGSSKQDAGRLPCQYIRNRFEYLLFCFWQTAHVQWIKVWERGMMKLEDAKHTRLSLPFSGRIWPHCVSLSTWRLSMNYLSFLNF